MKSESLRRTYKQGARAVAAEATAEKIVAAFRRAIEEHWFDEIRLEDVARDAGVTVQTVIRRFGGKEGLIAAAADQISEEVRARREFPIGDIAASVARLAGDYEAAGDLMIRMVAQDARFEAVRGVTDMGRRGHRELLEEAFAPQLAHAPDEAQRRQLVDALVAATDVYVWKLYRRDMGRSAADYVAAVTWLVTMILDPASAPKGAAK